jgi:hypothetical protein
MIPDSSCWPLLVVLLAACHPGPPATTDARAAGAAPTCISPEAPCPLADGRIGWCDAKAQGEAGPCRDLCGPGRSYSNTDTACHRPCGAGCNGTCAHEGLCFESPDERDAAP